MPRPPCLSLSAAAAPGPVQGRLLGNFGKSASQSVGWERPEFEVPLAWPRVYHLVLLWFCLSIHNFRNLEKKDR